MVKTRIDEDKSTPLGELYRWGRKWLGRDVRTTELIGSLSVAKDWLSVLMLEELREGLREREGKKRRDVTRSRGDAERNGKEDDDGE